MYELQKQKWMYYYLQKKMIFCHKIAGPSVLKSPRCQSWAY